jgi:protein O-GlcNAc transferase
MGQIPTAPALALAQEQFTRGVALHRTGQFGLAQSHYERAVKLSPKDADMWHMLGLAAFQLGVMAKAVKHLEHAVQLRPEFAEAWNNLGIARKAKALAAVPPAGLPPEALNAAEDAFSRALVLRPHYVEAAHNLAILFEAKSDFDRARQSYEQALAWRPDALNTLTNLGNLRRKLGDFVGAKTLLQRVQSITPSASSALNLALALLDLGDNKAAMQYAQAALNLEPDWLDALAALGTAARLENDLTSALPALRRVVELSITGHLISTSEALLELGLAENAAGDFTAACTHLSAARLRAPKHERLRWNAQFLLPTLLQDADQLAFALQSFAESLAEFEARTDWAKVPPDKLLEAVLSTSSFDLAYLPGDSLALQLRFGALVSRVVRDYIKPRMPLPPGTAHTRHAGKIRIGVVSSYLREHTVMRYFAGFITALCAQKNVEVWLWYTGGVIDAQTSHLKNAAHYFYHAHASVLVTASDIQSANLDVLIFPDMSMDPQQQLFAAWRLAPCQAVLYGHPISTGLAEMDVYFSAAALESVNVRHLDTHPHYSERLVLLPGIGAALDAPKVAPDGVPVVDAALLACPVACVRLICTQSLAKLTPEFDHAVAKILAGSQEYGARLYLFDREPNLSARYVARLACVLAAHGVDSSRVELIPACAYDEFMRHLALSDLVLDSPWFSGGATSIDAFTAGVPVLSWADARWQGPFARGYQTRAMLDLMGLGELCCDSRDAFVSRALTLINDPSARTRLRAQIAAQRHVLFASDATECFVREVLALAGEHQGF